MYEHLAVHFLIYLNVSQFCLISFKICQNCLHWWRKRCDAYFYHSTASLYIFIWKSCLAMHLECPKEMNTSHFISIIISGLRSWWSAGGWVCLLLFICFSVWLCWFDFPCNSPSGFYGPVKSPLIINHKASVNICKGSFLILKMNNSCVVTQYNAILWFLD